MGPIKRSCVSYIIKQEKLWLSVNFTRSYNTKQPQKKLFDIVIGNMFCSNQKKNGLVTI
jgi:hypothetical protein